MLGDCQKFHCPPKGCLNPVFFSFTDVQRLSLEVMTLNPVCESVETSEGVPLTVTGVAQCKIMPEGELLDTALEQFLGKTPSQVLKQTLNFIIDTV